MLDELVYMDQLVYSDVGVLRDSFIHADSPSPTSPSHHMQGPPGSGSHSATSYRYLADPPIDGKSTANAECQTRVTIATDMLYPTFSPGLALKTIGSLNREELQTELQFQGTVMERDLANREATEFLSSGLSDSHRPEIERLLKTAHESNILSLSVSCAIAECVKIVEDLKTSRRRTSSSHFDMPRLLPELPELPTKLTLVVPTATELETSTTTSSAATPLSPAPSDFEALDSPIAQVTIPNELEPMNMAIDELCGGIILGNEGTRRIAHFGTDYYYGGKLHSGRVYPKTPAIEQVTKFMEGAVPGFSKERYSCTINVYQNGRAGIPWHSDDEAQIAKDSLIYTLSLGAPRLLEFRARTGPTREESCSLEHGSLWAMSRASQDDWAHSIQPTTEPCGPRASLTFRILNPPKRDEREYVPPIKKRKGFAVPKKVEPTPSPVPPPRRSGKDRVLLLTDSIHRSMPAHAFPPQLHLEKQVMFNLTDLHKHESEFEHAAYVVISSGINDISRYGQTAESLSLHLERKLGQYRTQFPGTTFVLNSVLLGRADCGTWLNDEIKTFCVNAKRICTKFNTSYFDSDEVCRAAASRGTTIIDPRGNGIHITFDARRAITRALVSHMLTLNTLTF